MCVPEDEVMGPQLAGKVLPDPGVIQAVLGVLNKTPWCWTVSPGALTSATQRLIICLSCLNLRSPRPQTAVARRQDANTL